MSKRFLTYNTEDSEAGKVPVNSQGIIDPEKIPCYDSRDIRTVTYTVDGNPEGKEVIQGMVYLGDIPNCQNIADAVFTMTMSSHMATLKLQPTEDSGWWTEGGNLYYVPADEEVDGDMLKAGLYAVTSFYAQAAGLSITCDYVVSGELKKLDDKFIPSPLFIVDVIEQVDDDTGEFVFTGSVTNAEIFAAYSAGKLVIVRMDTIMMYPREISSGFAEFCDLNGDGFRLIMEDDSWSSHKPS